MKIVVENSTWNNVGDAFYQFPLYKILKNTLKQHDVYMFDGPIYRSFKIPNTNFFKKKILDIRQFIDADIFVFSGPILLSNFINHYGELIKNIKNNNKEYMILSAFGDTASSQKNIKFLLKYPPLAFSSRTKKTYDLYSEVANKSLDGICNAFFMSKSLKLTNLNLKNYIIYSFYSMPEPIIDFKLNENIIDLQSIKVNKRKNYLYSMYRHFQFIKYHPGEILNKKILRTVHDISYKFSHLNFARDNSYLSYNPLNYLSLYKNSELTISDRVHACVAALSFNKPAVLVGDWGERAELFQKLKIEKKNNVFLPTLENQINQEYTLYIDWIKDVFK